MKHLYFARHGLSVLNTEGKVAGSTDTPLAPAGREQAMLAGKKAQNLKIDYIISSPLSRALATAQLIAAEIGYPPDKIDVHELMVERHFGELEGKPWSPDLNMDGISDIETVDTLLVRARLALDYIESVKANNILVVSHGSFGRALRHHVLKDFPYSHPHRLENAELYQWL